MKTYGNGMKATSISKKQIGVIYRNAKEGILNVEKWVMSDLYNIADFYGYDDSRGVEECENKIRNILDDVFDGNMVSAQERIDRYTEWKFNHISNKRKSGLDRNMVA